MEQKLVRVPFDVELAKKITKGKIDGKVVTRDGGSARIICWDSEGDQPIIALIKFHDKEYPHSFYQNGSLHDGDCLNGDLMLEIPEYMTFKEGDIVSYEGGTFILKNIDGKDRVEYYASLYGIYTAFDSACSMKNLVNHLRFSIEEEKRELIGSMKMSKQPVAKEYLKRFFNIEVKPECEFKPFDKVIVRDGDRDKWKADFFSHKIEDNSFPYICVSDSHKYCIPYNDQTKHLLGTKDNWEE